MTVCIAAKAENGTGLVLAADQMATMHHVIREAEGSHKIRQIADKIFILLAGTGVWGNEVIKRVVEQKDQIRSVRDCAHRAQEAYVNQRLALVEQQYLYTRGMSLKDFLANQKNLQPNIAAMIDQQVQTFGMDVVMLVAGIDPNGEATIYEVSPPGIAAEVGDFAAIGIGGTHATNSLLARDFKKEMEEKKVAYLVYEAKVRSEVAPGVGLRTDMIIVGEKSREIPDGVIKHLREIYERVAGEEQKILEGEAAKINLEGEGQAAPVMPTEPRAEERVSLTREAEKITA